MNELEHAKARSVERQMLCDYVNKALRTHASVVTAPVWETEEEWRQHTPVTVNFQTLVFLCTTDLIRSCVQHQLASDELDRWTSVNQLIKARREADLLP